MEAYQPPSRVDNYFLKLTKAKFFSTESFELDIERDDEEVAIVVQSLEQGARANEASLYSNKEFFPPLYKEKLPIPAGSLQKRLPGNVPFGDVNFQAAGSAMAMKGLAKLEKKIMRSIELQAAQVFQTGALTLNSAAGVALFSMNFSPKAAHFPTAAVTWATNTTDIPTDIGNLAEVITRNGKARPTRLTFGRTAFRHFLNNNNVRNLLDKQVLNRGALVRPVRGVGDGTEMGVFHGEITIDSNTYEIYTYDGWYKDPQTGNFLPYLAADRVVLTSPQSEVYSAFGLVPQFPADAGSAALQFMPASMQTSNGMQFTPTAWISQDRQSLTVQLAARPLVVPVGIDTFGCIDTVP